MNGVMSCEGISDLRSHCGDQDPFKLYDSAERLAPNKIRT